MSTMLYKYGGKHKIHGGNYDYIIVDGEDEIEQAIEDGWFLTTGEAKAEASGGDSLPDDTVVTDDIVNDTKEEENPLHNKAKALGIRFAYNISDKKLAEKIAVKEAEES